jgi:sulfhydrogenase subunit alpha
VHALALSAEIMKNYTVPKRSRIPITPRSGIGGHGTEAPRGICWHQYRTNADGSIAAARIIPPTSQNQLCIEQDLRELAGQMTDLDDEPATLRCEHLIRNYDPCISCSVHFLRLERTST